MTKLAEAIANTVTAAQNQDWTKLVQVLLTLYQVVQVY